MAKKEKVVIPIEVDAPVPMIPAPPLSPTTTEQEDIATAAERESGQRIREGQRRVNLIWEFTQGIIAVMLVLTVSTSMLLEKEVRNEFWLLVAIVVQSYFQRTNHTRVGGVGYKPEGETR